MNRFGVAVVWSLGILLVSCGGGSKPAVPPPGATCTVNSDCRDPLSCTFNKCHEQCREDKDCTRGSTCVKTTAGNVCLLAEEERCGMNSMCPQGLVCAKDLRCRAECVEDRDCATRTQKCVGAMAPKTCAEPRDIDPATGDLRPSDGGAPPTTMTGGRDGGAGGTGGGGAAGAAGAQGQPDAARPMDGGAPDAPPAASDGPRMVPDATVEVEGVTADKPMVRQGDIVVLTVNGPGLANPGDFVVSNFRVALQPGGTDTSFKLSVSVPHGAALGPKDLSFTTSRGHATKTAVFTVTAITASPMGNDANHGASDKPFRTFSKALSVAEAEDTIRLVDGEYSMGETWMRPLPNKVTLIGDSTANTKLVGPGAAGASTSLDGLTFMGDATVKNLTVGFFNYPVRVNRPGTIVLENVKATGGRADGMYVDGMATGATVTITGKDSDFSGNAQSAVQIYSMGNTINLMGGTFSSMTTYPIVTNAAKTTLNVDGATINATGAAYYQAIYAYNAEATLTLKDATVNGGVSVGHMRAKLTATNTKFTLPMDRNGIDSYGANVTLTNCTFEGGGQQFITRAGEVVVRGTKFRNYSRYGIYITAGKLDLGTDAQPGNNEFTGPDMPGVYGLYDGRQRATDPITSSFTSFNGAVPTTGLVTRTAMMPVNVQGKYFIGTVENSIRFY